MCGIAGILNLNKAPVESEILKKMANSIRHRGPDGEGIYIDRYIGFAHRRLAIIDLSTNASQPMISLNNNIILTYNGEIYNFQEIKKELLSLNYQFQSKSDTEVILYAYQEWGINCIKRFNGMFAFALWDKPKQRLLLARDRYGIKPLYYTFQDNCFLFSSEHKAFLQHPVFSKQIDLEGLVEYFTFQNFFTDKTLLKNVQILPAGNYGIIDFYDPRGISASSFSSSLQITTYWDYSFEEDHLKSSEEEYIEELDRLFCQAVQRQMVCDVELGTYLSGGMDSGSITAIASKNIHDMKSFTCGFDLRSASGLELAFDEREKAEHMSYLFKTEHYEMVLKAGDMEKSFPVLAWYVEEPRVGQSYPNYYISRLASKFVKVVLTGTGGDELFGGYPWRYYRAANCQNFEEYIDKYYLFWQRLIPNKMIHEIFKPIWPDVKHVWTRDIFKGVFGNNLRPPKNVEDYINHSLYFEAKTFLHGLLVIEDKLSMANGLEARVPFLDNDLVDFAMKVPLSLKLKNFKEAIKINENELGPKAQQYFNQTNDGKILLRKTMEKYIPKSIYEDIKRGFSAPDASWFKGDSIDYVRKIVFDKNARIYDYFDYYSITGLIHEHLEGKQNRRLFLWSLLNFEWWLKIYLG
ncbi:MAG: asparagine synthase (glutamine-hydrolyzing) [Oligoflexia bacterium]|nr:asparagine synthase (glutamine-hydrolyzing) [Oligoflexia bacterium]